MLDTKHVAAPASVFARSVSIAALLKAGKLVKSKRYRVLNILIYKVLYGKILRTQRDSLKGRVLKLTQVITLLEH